ncbi:MAG: hypothetical protein LBE18_01875 [Planctomycetaceae bacterium]|jgi:hypothetical protein|nr:hypothetical protein [Planctomycetaceae bacterium]
MILVVFGFKGHFIVGDIIMKGKMYANLEALADGLQDAYQKGIKAKEEIVTVSFAPMQPYTPSEIVEEQNRIQIEGQQIACKEALQCEYRFS